MNASPRDPDEPFERLPLFPMPSAVLFPNIVMPLHVVEEQNRAMVADALEFDRPIVVSMLSGPEQRDTLLRPEVEPVAGLGVIADHEVQPDGSYKILLRGQQRVRIQQEHLVDTLYRQVRATPLSQTISDPERAATLIEDIHNYTLSPVLQREGITDALSQVYAQLDDPGDIADVVASFVFADRGERQKMLAELDVLRRLEAIEDRLAVIIADGHRARRAASAAKN